MRAMLAQGKIVHLLGHERGHDWLPVETATLQDDTFFPGEQSVTGWMRQAALTQRQNNPRPQPQPSGFRFSAGPCPRSSTDALS